jgi:predicted nucleic acid-binding protein
LIQTFSFAAQLHHPHHPAAIGALVRLRDRGDRLYLASQVLYEFWVVCTKPEGENGLGLTAEKATQAFRKVKQLFLLLAESPFVYPQWERLVMEHQVLGKSAHDARLVAAMRVYRLTHILTFNDKHFARYPEIVPVNPALVATK